MVQVESKRSHGFCETAAATLVWEGYSAFRIAKSFGDPDKTRTCYLLIRNQTLYPDELRDHGFSISN